MKVALICSEENGIPASCASAIREAGVELVCRKCESGEDLVRFAAGAQVIWFFGPNLLLNKETLEQLPDCKAIFRSGSGLDSIPKCAYDMGLKICNTPDSIAESVAEHAVSLLFALIRHIPQYDRQIMHGKWLSDTTQIHWHISRRCLGLVGYGRIARRVEEMMQGFHMDVIHYDPYAAGSLPLDEVLKKADYLSLHCPLTDETRGLIGAREFGLMKPNALLVNTSRGEVVDEDALYQALTKGTLGGAGLDVLCQEPPAADNPLLKLENVVRTPHIAAFSADFEKNFWNHSAAKIIELSKEF